MTKEEFDAVLNRFVRDGSISARTKRLILSAADDYAAGEAERIAHPPYRPPYGFRGKVKPRTGTEGSEAAG